MKYLALALSLPALLVLWRAIRPASRDVSVSWVQQENERLRRAGWEGVSHKGKFKR